MTDHEKPDPAIKRFGQTINALLAYRRRGNTAALVRAAAEQGALLWTHDQAQAKQCDRSSNGDPVATVPTSELATRLQGAERPLFADLYPVTSLLISVFRLAEKWEGASRVAHRALQRTIDERDRLHIETRRQKSAICLLQEKVSKLKKAAESEASE